jgi:hypothetical protein
MPALLSRAHPNRDGPATFKLATTAFFEAIKCRLSDVGEAMEMNAGMPRETVAVKSSRLTSSRIGISHEDDGARNKARGGMIMASLFNDCLLHGPFQPLCEIARTVNDTHDLDAVFN